MEALKIFRKDHGFSFNSICDDFPLDNLVVLDMQYSNLQKVWEGTKFLKSLKILDLSHSHCLSGTPDFLEVPNLEQKLCTAGRGS